MAHGYPDFEGNKARVYSGADWAAIEGTDVNLMHSGGNVAPGVAITRNYVVPALTTLYIVWASASCVADLVADADNNQFCELVLWDWGALTVYADIAMNGGGPVYFPKPIVIPAGHTCTIQLYNRANHNCDLKLTVMGYEIAG